MGAVRTAEHMLIRSQGWMFEAGVQRFSIGLTWLPPLQAIELVDDAWRQVSLRPSLQQVAAEVAEWKAKQLPALLGIARHLADAVLKDVVDELIAEVRPPGGGATCVYGQPGSCPHRHHVRQSRT